MERITNETLANAFIEEQLKELREQIGTKKVLLALSGGVDSSVVAALLIKAIGKNLVCVHVNHGLLRKGESEQVIEVFRNQMDANLVYVDATDRFLDKLAGVSDPEKKRKIIGAEFIEVFAEEAAKQEGIEFLAQGTIYPDILESVAGIKAHHNVGGLPEKFGFELVEPVKYLFKDEVRAVGEELGLPHGLVWRQPFPGPGLAVRITGEITKEKCDLLREADAIFREELEDAGFGEHVSQYFAVLADVRSVGVMGDFRTYGLTVVLRAVTTDDFMTAEWSRLPLDLLERVSNRITNEVGGVSRVVYDITSKPPATVEWL
jgi:GMP synthase (glutamine-hydrolysing)